MPKRGAGGRFVKRGSRPRRKSYGRAIRRRLGAIRARAAGPLGGIRRRIGGAFRGLPPWAKPSNLTAGIGVATGIGQLVFTPLPNGQTWHRRLLIGYDNYKKYGTPSSLLGMDTDGSDVATIAVKQLSANAPKAIATVAGFGIVAAILKWAGM